MAHVFLQSLDIIAGLETVYGKGVTKIVNAVMTESGFLQDLLEFLPDGRLNVVVAVIMDEDQSGKITLVPQGTGSKFLLCLYRLMMLQHIHDERCRNHDSGFAVFQAAPVAFSSSALFTGHRKLLFDVDDTLVEIYAVPGQTDQFAASEACKQVGKDQVLERLAFEGCEEAFLLFLVQGLYFGFLDFRDGTDGSCGWERATNADVSSVRQSGNYHADRIVF